MAAIALFVRERVAVGALDVAMVGALAGFVAWIALSAAWSSSAERSILEVQRGLVYVAALLTIFVVARDRSVAELVAAVIGAAAVVCAYALVRLLFPTGSDTSVAPLARLSEPLGYLNALALVAAVGALLALASAAHARSRATRAFSSASVVVFALTMFFTFSRGAWIAVAVGLIAMVALDSHRFALVRTLAAAVPVAAVAVWLGSRAHVLATPGGRPSEAVHEGHLLALATVLLAATAALTQAASRRFAPGRRASAVAFAAVVAASAVAVVHYGSRPRLGRPVGSGQRRPTLAQANTSLRLSLSGRRALWRAAWKDWKAHPALGSGAGTFELYWVRHRRTSAFVRDAHSLYVETLAELGPVGLLLLVAALVVPLVGAARSRGHPLVPGAAAAYVAYLVHAGVDWDWEMPAVTLLGLLCGAALVLAAREEPRLLPRPARMAVLAATLALVPFAFVGLIGNGALAASARAAAAGQSGRSASEAERATRWLPWSSEAWWRLGIAQSEENRLDTARASLRRAIAKSPEEWRPWVTLMRLSTGRAQRRALREAARLDPREPEVVQFLLAPGSLDQSWSYDDAWIGWPVAPVHEPHPIRGAFLVPRAGTLRAGGEPAYHFGVDIGVRDDRPEAGAPPGRTHRVYAIEGGTAHLPAHAHGACVNGKVVVGHFSYWHVDAVVANGQRVQPGQAIGWTCKGLWHVHLAEELDLYGRFVYVNPMRRGGKLGPSPDDTPPRVHAVELFHPAMPRWRVAGGVSFPRAGVRFPTVGGRAVVSGRVDVRAWVDDAPPSSLGSKLPPALVSPSPPDRLSLEVIRAGAARPVIVRTVFRSDVYLGSSVATQAVPIGYHYAPGTRAALPATVCLALRRRHCGGTYWFRLFAWPTAAYWDTTRLPDGDYRLRVTAWDAAGNSASRVARVTIRNRT